MNTVRANITSSRYAETNSIFQYDTGRKLEIYGCNLPKSVEVQFSTDKEKGNTITRVGNTNNGVTTTIIPNQLLNDSEKTSNFCIFAFLYNVDNDGGRTEYVIKIPVVARPKPENPSEEPLPEPNIFHETVVAVNASAERAENAPKETKEIRDNLNLDLSEKITRPQTAEVGQVLAVKEIDESGKPTVFEAEDVKVPTKTSELENDSGFLTEHQDISGKLDKEKLPEAIDDALTQAKESGEFNGKDGAPGEKGEKGEPGETTYIENPYDDTEIKKEIATKVGYSEVVGNKLLMYADNTKEKLLATLELPSSVEDVHINGESIVQDGIAKIPIAKNQILGLAQPTSRYRISQRTPDNVNGIYANQYISNSSLDAAVVAAMCDGKGAAWTAEEQAAARERMGALSTQDMIDITEITMDAETLKYVFPSFADYRILEISFSKTKKELTGLTGNIWLKLDNVGWVVTSIFGDAYNMFILDASGKSCAGKNMHTNNPQIAINMQGLIVDKKYWDTEFRGAPYILLPNIEWAQYFAECNTAIKVRGIKR